MSGFEPFIAPVVDVATRLGALASIKAKLMRQPDPAADKLVEVLDEVSKIYLALEAELTRYLSLGFDADQSAKERRQEEAELAALVGGQVVARMRAAKGHCSKIVNIYNRFLNPWFGKALSKNEQDDMQQLFRSLDEFDGQMVRAIDALADRLESHAQETLDFVDDGFLDQANEKIKAFRKEVQPDRKKIAQAMASLRDLEGDFIAMSGAVGNSSTAS